MQCPTCTLELRRLTKLSIHSWICDTCKSVAAEIGSLHDTVPHQRVSALENAIRDGHPGDRKCPKCASFMRRGLAAGGYGRMEIDGCTTCRLAWFDHGELRNMQSVPGSGVKPARSSMTPAERHAWRIAELRRDATVVEDESTAAVLSLILGIPYPDPIRAYEGRPIITWAVCALVIGTSVLAFAVNFDAAVWRFGMIPNAVAEGHLSGVITHFFLHGDVLHLVGNLLFLFMFGSRVEALVGGGRYLVLIAASTVMGGFIHAAFAPDPSIPLIGASGGISGVLAAHACLRPRSRIRMLFFFQPVSIPATVGLAAWVVLQLIGAGMQFAGTSAVSALGHLGGASAGFLVALLWRGRARAIDPASAW